MAVNFSSDGFREPCQNAFGESRMRWLADLDAIVQRCSACWDLGEIEQLEAQAWNFVGFSGIRSDVVLKVFYDQREFDTQASVLVAAQGTRMVRLWGRYDECKALLIERVQPATPLNALADDGEQMKAAADLIRSTGRISPPPSCRHVGSLIDELDEGQARICHDLIARTKEEFSELVGDIENEAQVHGDLHHGNILKSRNDGWVMIDPEGLIGDAYFDAATILRSCIGTKDLGSRVAKRARILCVELNLNHRSLMRWLRVTAMLAACWEVGDSLPSWKQALDRAQILADLPG